MLRGGCRDRQGQGRRARPDPRRRRGPARGGARRARPRRAGPGRRQRRAGTSTRRSPRSACWTGPPVGWSTSSSRARASRTWPPYAVAVDVPIAADESIRRAADPYRVRDLEAADIAVLKVQPLGGVRACLRIAEDIGLPVVVSSALETSVGIAAGVALAAALPELPYACGLATVQLLDRRRRRPSRCCRSTARCRCGVPERRRVALAGWPPRPTGSRTGRPGWPRCEAVRQDRRLVTLAPSWPAPWSTALVEAGVTEVVIAPGLAQRAAVASRRTTPPRPGWSGCTPASTSAPPASSRSGWPRAATGAAVICTSGTGVANLHPAVLEAAHAGAAAGRRHRRPAGPAARHRRQPDHRPGRHLRRRCVADLDVAAGDSTDLASAERPGAPQRPARRPAGARRTAGTPGRRPRARAPRRAAPATPTSRSPAGPRTVVVAGDDAGPPARVLAEAGRLAAARRAEQRLADRRRTRSAPTGCCSAPTSAAADRAGRRLRPPDAVAAGQPAARARRRRGASTPRAPGVWAERPFPVDERLIVVRTRRAPTTRPGWRSGARPTRSSRGSSTRCSPPSRTSRRTRSRGRSAARCRPAGCSSSAPPTRSATST